MTGDMQGSPILAGIKAAGRITDFDVLALRKLVWPDGRVSEAELDALFALNDGCADQTPAWWDFFIEAALAFVLQGTRPHGYVDAAQADWLLARINRDGRVRNATELELLVKLLERAVETPDELEAFALEQVRIAVLTGDGPLKAGHTPSPGVIDDVEVQLLRRILHAAAGPLHIGISRIEAELLFDLHDAARGAANAPSWRDVFVKGLTNHLMAHWQFAADTRAEAVRREAWLADTKPNVGRFLARTFRLRAQETTPQASSQPTQARALAERITHGEAQWLIGRLLKDGTLDANEQALLDYLAVESPSIHESLTSLREIQSCSAA
jgi:hypothetical protein